MQIPIPLSDVFKYYTSPGKTIQASTPELVISVRDSIRYSAKITSNVNTNPKRFELPFALNEELEPKELNFDVVNSDIEIIAEHPSINNFAIGLVLTDKVKADLPKIKKDLEEITRRNLRRSLTDLVDAYTLTNVLGILISDFTLEVKPMKSPNVQI